MAEKEYIEREPLKRDLIDRGFYPAIVKAAIENAPTADVVEVVRCRDCVYMMKLWGKVLCAKKVYSDDYSVKVLTPTNLDNFCNYGARMTGRRADNG
jgi:hypothetical protein